MEKINFSALGNEVLYLLFISEIYNNRTEN